LTNAGKRFHTLTTLFQRKIYHERRDYSVIYS